MLIARAPFRVSLAGGGTDLPSYYEEHGGLVISVAIDKHFYVFITPDGSGPLQISSADYQLLLRHSLPSPMDMTGDLKHARALLNHFGVNSGYSIFLASQVPPGTGLGSSSALAVALTKGVSTIRGQHLSKTELAETACRIELDLLSMPIGKQDQYAAAFGGLNAIRFEADAVTVEPLSVSPHVLQELNARLMLFFTRLSHDSSKILKDQTDQNRNGSNLGQLHDLKWLALAMRDAVEFGRLERVGEILGQSWEHKKQLAKGVSTPVIDAAYEAAIEAGATGGKVTGAGGGGFLLLYCEPPAQASVSSRLEDMGFVPLDFNFDSGGARVIVNHAN